MQRKGGARDTNPSLGRTRIARLRTNKGIDQVTLAKATGMGLHTLQNLERGETDNPRIRNLVNIAAALGVELLDVCEPEWLTPSKLLSYQVTDSGEPVERPEQNPSRFKQVDL